MKLKLQAWHIIHTLIYITIYLYSKTIMVYIDVKQLILIFGALHMLTIAIARKEMKNKSISE